MPDSYLPALVNELQAHGVNDYVLDDQGRHYKLRFTWEGGQLTHVFPRSPSDQRGIYNSLSDLRNSMGVKRQIQKSLRKKRRRNSTTSVEGPTTITIRSDPFAVLSKLKEKRKCPRLSLAAIAAMLNCA